MNITKNSKLFVQIFNITNPEGNLSDLIVSDDTDILGLKINSNVNINYLIKIINSYNINKPVMFIGSGEDEFDKLLLSEIAQQINKEECIFANINEKTYKEIVPSLIEKKHYAVLKTPIDINLAKELNILSAEIGLPLDRIIMNTDIGGLGYGYEYGYSIIEKVRLEGEKDKYLNFPIFSDASSEALKTKEAKSEEFSKSWGPLGKRATMIELSACAGIIAAGANIVALNHPENIKILKGIL